MELKITDLKKTYGNVKALKGINYTFTPGVYGILGANGAGKSTMINLITDNVSRDKNGGSIMLCSCRLSILAKCVPTAPAPAITMFIVCEIF